MIQEVFLEVCQALRNHGGPVYSSEAKHLVDLHEYYLTGKFFESDIQKQEVYTGLTTLVLCQLAKAAMHGDLESFPGVPENDLGRFFLRHQASAELQHHLVDEMPSGDITVEILERLEDDAWQRVTKAMMTPKVLAWMRVREHVARAMSDPTVNANPDATAFLERMGELLKEATGGMLIADVLKPMLKEAKSANSKQNRAKRTALSNKVKAKALALYDAGGYAKFTNAKAAKGIYESLQAYAQSLTPKQTVSPTRFAKTLGEWLAHRRKNTANQ